MKFLSQRLLFILLSVAFLIGAFIVYSNFIKPEYETISALRADLTAKSDTLVRYQESFTKLQNMLGGQDVGQLEDSVSRILPGSPDFGYLSAQLVGFAKLNGLSVVLFTNALEPIRTSDSKIIRSIGKIKTQLRIRGTYSGIQSYVRQLEDNLLIMDVTAFTAEVQKKQQETEGLEYTLVVTSYYQVR